MSDTLDEETLRVGMRGLADDLNASDKFSVLQNLSKAGKPEDSKTEGDKPDASKPEDSELPEKDDETEEEEEENEDDETEEEDGDKGDTKDDDGEAGYHDLRMGEVDAEPLLKALLDQNGILAKEVDAAREERDEFVKLTKGLVQKVTKQDAEIAELKDMIKGLTKTVCDGFGAVGGILEPMAKANAAQLLHASREVPAPATTQTLDNALNRLVAPSGTAAAQFSPQILAKGLRDRVLSDSELSLFKRTGRFSDDEVRNSTITINLSKL